VEDQIKGEENGGGPHKNPALAAKADFRKHRRLTPA